MSFLITGDEERPAINGMEKLPRWAYEKGERFDHCIVGEPTSFEVLGDTIKIGRRGCLDGTLIVAGRCLVKFGAIHVLCAASLEDKPPTWLRGQGRRWITAEYGMLTRATHTRTRRESNSGKLSGRTHEIQRLIGRSLRAVTNLQALGERQITIDCDVLQADGGTRTAAITGPGSPCTIVSNGCTAARSSGIIPCAIMLPLSPAVFRMAKRHP